MEVSANHKQRKPIVLQRTDEEGSQMWELSNIELSRVAGADGEGDSLNTSSFTCSRTTGECVLDGTSNDD